MLLARILHGYSRSSELTSLTFREIKGLGVFMREKDINTLIVNARRDKQLKLDLAKFTAEDVSQLAFLLKAKYPLLEHLVLENILVKDAEAVVLAELITRLPLTHFSLQGLHLGDQCIAAMLHHNPSLSATPSPSVSATPSPSIAPTLAPTHSRGSVSASDSRLKSLEIGGLQATDICLPLLAKFIEQHPGLEKCSINWSNNFSVKAAWALAARLAIHNVSLCETNYHGFFHSFDNENHKIVHFINAFCQMVNQRNQQLAKTKSDDHYQIYVRSLTKYNEAIVEGFATTQELYMLDGFCDNDLFCTPLPQPAFNDLLREQGFRLSASATSMTSTLDERKDFDLHARSSTSGSIFSPTPTPTLDEKKEASAPRESSSDSQIVSPEPGLSLMESGGSPFTSPAGQMVQPVTTPEVGAAGAGTSPLSLALKSQVNTPEPPLPGRAVISLSASMPIPLPVPSQGPSIVNTVKIRELTASIRFASSANLD